MSFEFPLDTRPAHEKYGFGDIPPGTVVVVDLDDATESAIKIQGHVGSHATYHGKKFKTKRHDGKLYIKRLS